MLKIEKNFCLISNCISTFILFFYFFVNISYASTTGIVYLTTNYEIMEKGEEIEIVVNIDDTKTASFNFSLYFDDSKLECVSAPETTNIVGNRIICVWYDTQGGNGAKQGELAKFKFKTKEDGIATFSIQGEFYSEKGQLIQTKFVNKQIQIGKNESELQKQAKEEQGITEETSNTNLQVLRLNKEGMIPDFNKNVFEYYLTIPNDIQDVDVLAISENANASINISGNTNLKEGLNDIIIQVVSEDGTQNKVYTIHTTKTSNIQLANTNLEILAIENVLLNPAFDINEINYKTEVSNETTNLNVLAVPENENAHIEISGKDNLKEGNNLVKVLVVAPNGFTKKNYQIEVYRRNLEEETKYQEEQKMKNEKLEQAYKIQELSTNSENIQIQNEGEVNKDKKQNNVIFWVVISIVVLGIVLLVIYSYNSV